MRFSVAQFNSNEQIKIDSLNTVINESPFDTSIAAAYYELSEIIYIINLDTLQSLCEIAKDISNKNLESELSLKERESFLKTLAGSLNNIGYVHKKHGEIPEALDYYHKSLIIQEQIGNKTGTANLLNNIAVIYESQNDISKALEYYQKALDIFREVDYPKGIAATLNNIGVIYSYAKKDTIKTLQYYIEALHIREGIGDKVGISNSLNNIGHVYSRLNENEKALKYHSRALLIRQQLGDKRGIVSSLYSLADLYYKLELYQKSKVKAFKALRVAQSAGFPSDIGSSALLLKKIFKSENNTKEELRMFELHIQMRDSLDNVQNRNAVYKQQVQYDYEKKKAIDDINTEKQLAIAEEKKQKQKIVTLAISTVLLLVIIFSIFIFRRWKTSLSQKKIIEKQRDQLEQKSKEREFMMKEIHHRVKNNLQIVNSLLSLQANQIDDENINNMFREAQNRVLSMALIHEKMYQSEDLAQIDIKDHFNLLIKELIKDYQIGIDIKLVINIEQIDIGMKTLIPLGLIINEIISNALKHAFKQKDNGKIIVELKHINNNSHELIIGDDGVGMNRDFNFEESSSLGTELIHVFTEQLEGHIERLPDSGTIFKIVFNSID